MSPEQNLQNTPVDEDDEIDLINDLNDLRNNRDLPDISNESSDEDDFQPRRLFGAVGRQNNEVIVNQFNQVNQVNEVINQTVQNPSRSPPASAQLSQTPTLHPQTPPQQARPQGPRDHQIPRQQEAQAASSQPPPPNSNLPASQAQAASSQPPPPNSNLPASQAQASSSQPPPPNADLVPIAQPPPSNSDHVCPNCGFKCPTKTGLGVHKKRWCKGLRLQDVLPQDYKEASERMKAAKKKFLADFKQETSDILANTPSDSNVTCPDCSSEVPRGSFRFHREVPCPAKKLKKKWDVRDYY